MDMSGRKAPGCVAAFVLCGFAGLTVAGQPDDIVVTYRGLDLNTPGGVASLYARLEAAARTVCAARAWSRHEIDLCVDYRVRQAVAEIGAPRLVTLYEIRSGHAVVHARRRSPASY